SAARSASGGSAGDASASSSEKGMLAYVSRSVSEPATRAQAASLYSPGSRSDVSQTYSASPQSRTCVHVLPGASTHHLYSGGPPQSVARAVKVMMVPAGRGSGGLAVRRISWHARERDARNGGKKTASGSSSPFDAGGGCGETYAVPAPTALITRRSSNATRSRVGVRFRCANPLSLVAENTVTSAATSRPATMTCCGLLSRQPSTSPMGASSPNKMKASCRTSFKASHAMAAGTSHQTRRVERHSTTAQRHTATRNRYKASRSSKTDQKKTEGKNAVATAARRAVLTSNRRWAMPATITAVMAPSAAFRKIAASGA